MIPRDYITEWRARAPWVQDAQVEQDLVVARALVALFSQAAVANELAFRGGTALYKLYLTPPARYSEDIDLVQTAPGPIGPVMDGVREALDPWLGKPKWKQTRARVTVIYRFASEDAPPLRLRLKVEINSREHYSVFGLVRIPFTVTSRWFSGTADIVSYELDELLATKLRALYQRRKGRDLFDLATALDRAAVNPTRVAEAFAQHMARTDGRVRRPAFERNLAAKVRDPQFAADIGPLLAHGYSWDLEAAAQEVRTRLISLLPGTPGRREG
ncbi:MAG: nucleotidyl transferase AbiEii/AbiGii toxin family protein [Acidobacteriota bacterium]|nr:nucleotidyl transferase AbiEii/AbiGii toxin family protein [Acidobacteriota bacterium]